jgi:hypothetical protein
MGLSVSDVIPLSIMQGGRSKNSVLSFQRVVKKDHRHLFRCLIS